MPKTDFADYVVSDLLREISGVSHKSMFGGFGIYKGGLMFGLIADDKLYLKVDDTNRSDFEEKDCGPFVYSQGNHKETTMQYYEVPVDLVENPVGIEPWAQKAYEVAVRAKKK